MSETLWTIIIIAVVFLILALAVTLKYDSVSHTFKFRDFSIGITGEKHKPDETPVSPPPSVANTPDPSKGNTGQAKIVIGGSMKHSRASIQSDTEASFKVEKDLRNSNVGVAGNGNTEASIGGDVKNSDLDVKNENK